MKITDPITQEFWDWLVLMGWREVRMSKNKRRYDPLPPETLRTLQRAPRREWEAVHRQLVD